MNPRAADGPAELKSRQIMAVLRESLSDFRVVVLNGARQSGKTVLLGQIHRLTGGTFVSLDDTEVLEAAIADPAGFAAGFQKPLLIDEVQRAGDGLLRAIKAEVDRHSRHGQFVLAGSTRFLTVPTLSESLAGRARIVDLWPFSQGEIAGTDDRFIDRIFEEPGTFLDRNYSENRAGYFRRLCMGGFPEPAAKRSERARAAWFDAYVRTITQRDIREISRIRQATELPRLLRLIAGLTGHELVVTRLAERAGLDDQTVHNYLPLLETVYLLHRVSGWSRNLTAKIKRRAKVHLSDTGLAAHLLGVNAAGLVNPVAPAAGQLLETFVVNELAKQRTWASLNVEMYHLRDRDGAEVDVVLEARDGRVVALEVKAAATVSRSDFRWLELIRNKLGNQFVHGAVLYTGSRGLPFGDRLSALPLSALWETPADKGKLRRSQRRG